jgi:hypothetical protein
LSQEFNGRAPFVWLLSGFVFTFLAGICALMVVVSSVVWIFGLPVRLLNVLGGER